MKKIFLLSALAISTLGAIAQNSNVQSAANSLKFDELVDAKKFIDLAAENEKTANDPKMWYFRGKIYLAIGESKKTPDLDKDAGEKATVSFINCLKTDTRDNYKEECKDLIWIAASRSYNSAIEAYNNNDFEKAKRLYSLIFDVMPFDDKKNLQRNNITPESIYKNLYFVAIKAKDNAKAKEYLQKLIDKNYNDPLIYIYMSRVYLGEKDTTKALEYISKGRYLFEENKDLINEELRIYIAKGDVGALIEKLTKAIETTPDREELYYDRGRMYDEKKDIDKAAADYKKAIEIKSDYFDAYYNLGAMYYNQAAEMLNAAKDIKSDTEYNKAKAKADSKFKNEALPALEKALELMPNDKNTLISLKQLYVRLNDTAKLAQVTATLNSLK